MKRGQVSPEKADTSVNSGTTDTSDAISLQGERVCREEIVTGNLSMDSTNILIKMHGMQIPGFMSQRERTKERYEYISPDSIYYTVLSDSGFTKSDMFGEKTDSVGVSPLTGLRILKTRDSSGTWSYVTTADFTPEQLRALSEKSADEDNEFDTQFYPAGKVKVGHSWGIDVALIKSLLDDDLKEATGSGRMVFKELITYKSEQCALITGKMNLKGVDSDKVTVNFNVHFTLIRSLERYMDLSIEINGSVSGHMVEDSDNGKVEMEIEGPFRASQVSEVK